MRTGLTGIQSRYSWTPHLSVVVAATDGSSWTFTASGHIQGMSRLNWEVPFGGGWAKPVSYRITLLSSEGFWRTNLRKLVGASVTLRAQLDTSCWNPHVGHVRGILRDGGNLSAATLDVDDRHIHEALFPEVTLLDSYSSPHLEDLALGAPTYYGINLRPIYFAAVTCDLSTLLGPRYFQRSAAVSSLHFSSDLSLPAQYSQEHSILLVQTWPYSTQLSPGLQTTGGTGGFQVVDPGGGVDANSFGGNLSRFWGFAETVQQDQLAPASWGLATLPVSPTPQVVSINRGHVAFLTVAYSVAFFSFVQGYVPVRKIIPQEVSSVAYVSGKVLYATTGIILPTSFSFRFKAHRVDGSSLQSQQLFGQNATNPILPTSVTPTGARAAFLASGPTWGFGAEVTMSTSAGIIRDAFDMGLQLSVYLRSEGYKRYSVFAEVANSSDISVSARPAGILSNIMSAHLGIAYNVAASSAAQTSAFNMTCLYDEQQPFAEVAAGLLQPAAIYGWVGDAGTVQLRSYVESGVATSSIAAIITRNEMLSPLEIEDQPIGFGGITVPQARKVRLRYAYNYQSGAFEKSVVRDENNNALCDSADAAGVRDEATLDTRNIMAAEVASLAANWITRRHCQGFQSITMTLPAAFMGLELADIIQVRDGMLPNSADLFQVYRVSQNLLDMTVEITAGRIQNTDGN